MGENERAAIESCNVGTVAKLREALVACMDYLERVDHPMNDVMRGLFKTAYDKAQAALAAPPRNCDAFSKAEVLEMLEDRSFSKEDTIEWLFAEAKGDAMSRIDTRKKATMKTNSKIRDALNAVYDSLVKQGIIERWCLVEMIDAAFAEQPVRNCEVGTAEEQADRYEVFCAKYFAKDRDDNPCGSCPLSNQVNLCKFAWAQMPYEK